MQKLKLDIQNQLSIGNFSWISWNIILKQDADLNEELAKSKWNIEIKFTPLGTNRGKQLQILLNTFFITYNNPIWYKSNSYHLMEYTFPNDADRGHIGYDSVEIQILVYVC